MTVLMITDNSGHGVLLLGTPTDPAGNEPELVFAHSGDSYYLKQVDSNLLNVALLHDKATKERLAQSAQVFVAADHSQATAGRRNGSFERPGAARFRDVAAESTCCIAKIVPSLSHLHSPFPQPVKVSPLKASFSGSY